MDNGRGAFDSVTGEHYRQMLEDAAKTGIYSRIDKIFSEGEQIQIKQRKFIVKSIDYMTGIMTIKLLQDKKPL